MKFSFSPGSRANGRYTNVRGKTRNQNIIDFRFLTTETNLKAYIYFVVFHNLISKAICCDYTDFGLEIFVYNHETIQTIYFENESTF